ncbi:Hypothetical predicted protein [Mytilus galloprovincialis]|uniref:Chitin-binding type-2 domain-containing protein n=1 Tax=Mytilus galloprovincialis TaxID=29158 RepID=A0A8B6HPR0_MYTGA|nr:Hypothetical predicted protein [Mytilus galloprovincialis]
MSFDDRNFSAYLNRSYSDGFSPPPDICGKQRHSNGYLHPCNRYEKGISSNHDYLSVQGSIREESQVDKVSNKPPDFPHNKYIKNKEENTEPDMDDDRIYNEIADSTKLRTSGQSDVKCCYQKEYVLGTADDYCLPQDKEANKPSANFHCSPCRMIILAAIIIILLIGLGCAAYFLWLRNTNENEKTDTLNNTQHSITSTIVSSTFRTPIFSTEAQTDTPTNPASTLTTSTDQVLSTTKGSSPSEAPSSTTEIYCSPTDRIIFQLNPDQIADPEVSRNLLPHTCEAYVGYPAGDISIEILKSGEQEFRKLDVIIESTVDNRTSCEIHRKIVFRIVFTSDMEKAIIRCSVINKHFPDSPAFYSKNETVRLIPGDSCKDNTVSQSNRVHPTNCKYYIECQNKEPYGRACQYGYCFGIYTVETCTPCNDVTCPATSSSCTNTTVVQKQNKVNMTIHSDQVAGLTSTRASNLHSCSGLIGNLTGDIQVQIQLAGNNNYQTIIPSYTTKVDTTENCELKRVLKFWIGFTVDMYNATIRCRVKNGFHPDVSPIYSNSVTLYLVSSDFCNQNFNSTITNKYHHPTTCHRFISCVGNAPYVHTCSSGLCFSLKEDRCEYCNLVKTCP